MIRVGIDDDQARSRQRAGEVAVEAEGDSLNVAEWQACKDLHVMMGFLKSKISERKLRLFIIACCRRVPRFTREDVCRRAVDIAERFADGAATRADLEEARKVVERELIESAGPSAHRAMRILASSCADPHLTGYGVNVASLARRFALVSKREEIRLQIGLLKDIVGNPFRLGVVGDSWFSWNDGMVRRLAQAIYDERAFDRLPILADALEEAGCSDPDILNHCRQPGEHVRGCWLIDAILRKT